MNTILVLNPEHATDEEVAGWSVREAARAVVLDGEGNVALLRVARKDYYKLPGGGIEAGETPEHALLRECREEIGCAVEAVGELGIVIENRKVFGEKQVSFCFLAKVAGEKREPDFTDEERAEGFRAVWLPYEEAARAIAGSAATDIEGGKYIVPRDQAILEAARRSGLT